MISVNEALYSFFPELRDFIRLEGEGGKRKAKAYTNREKAGSSKQICIIQRQKRDYIIFLLLQ